MNARDAYEAAWQVAQGLVGEIEDLPSTTIVALAALEQEDREAKALAPPAEIAHRRLLRSNARLFAAASAAGYDTRDRPAIRRLAGRALGRTVERIRDLDTYDRICVATWIESHCQH